MSDEKDGNPELYGIVNRYLAKGYSVLYCVEPDSSQTLKNMQRAGVEEMDGHVDDGTLHVMERDAFLTHLKQRENSQNMTEKQVFQKFKSMFDAASGKSRSTGRRKKSKTIFFGHPTARYEPDDFEWLLVNEQALEQFEHKPKPSEIVCCFSAPDLRAMALWQIFSILNVHNKIFHAEADKDDRWFPSSTVDLIEAGIEKSLGNGSSKIILSTINLVYGIDEKAIVENPLAFEAITSRVLGRRSDSVINAIKNEVIGRLAMVEGS